jgi:hypothetical protein
MTRIGFDIPEEKAKEFAEAASKRGGKSAVMRQLIELFLAEFKPAEISGGGLSKLGRGAAKVAIRLEADEVERLDREAESKGMTRNGWAARYLRSRLRGAPQFTADEAKGLALIAGELRRIGTNVNQIARAMNVAKETGEFTDHEIAEVTDAHREIMEFAAAVRAIRSGRLNYWVGEDG